MSSAHNPYAAPKAAVQDDLLPEEENTSGMGEGHPIPDGADIGWSTGAFLLNWIWCVFNKSYIGLLCLVPYIGFLFAFYLGFRGRTMAWQNKRWDSVEHFNRVQRRWSVWSAALILVPAVAGIVAAILIPMYAGRH